MRNNCWRLVSAMGALALAMAMMPNTQAQCGLSLKPVKPASWHPQYAGGHPMLVLAGLDDGGEHEASIVGMWHVWFIVGSGSSATTVDAGYSQWHSDGTEIMNSGAHAPNTSNFCLGVWKSLGSRSYKVNHFAISWDPTKGPLNESGQPTGEIVGPVQIQENVTLSADGDRFSGTFTIDPYDEAGHHLAHVAGTITATRMTVDTPESSVF